TPTQSGSFTFTVKAADALGCSGTREYTLAINCPGVSFGPANLPKGNVGSAYNQTLQASGGSPPYTFNVVSGNLPSGLARSSSAGISGTPTEFGLYNVMIKATDSTGCSAQLPVQLVIDPRVATSVSSANYLPGKLTPDMIAAAFGSNLATTTL